jgi:hypothetical protein
LEFHRITQYEDEQLAVRLEDDLPLVSFAHGPPEAGPEIALDFGVWQFTAHRSKNRLIERSTQLLGRCGQIRRGTPETTARAIRRVISPSSSAA